MQKNRQTKEGRLRYLHNKILLQKLNYIHKNPCHPNWDLAAHLCDYLYSSAKFYYNRENSFDILQHYADI